VSMNINSFPILLASGVCYTRAKSGFSLRTVAVMVENQPFIRSLVEWVLQVNLMVPKRITVSQIF